MIRVLELAIISIVLAAAVVLGFLYLKTMVSTGQEVQKLRQVLQELETTFVYLRPVRYRICLRIATVETANTTLIIDGEVIVVEHVVKIYIGNTHYDCIWYRPWLCFNIYEMCGIIDLSRLGDRYYILHRDVLCSYVNVWVEKYGNIQIVHIS